MAKKPAEFFVNVKLLGITAPDASRAVSTPTIVPGIPLLFIVKLLMLIVMRLSACVHGGGTPSGAVRSLVTVVL
jgi:hypothetical protein